MNTNCDGFIEEIAAFASESIALTTEAAAHVQNCAACREKIAELKAVAVMHRQAAADMVEPKLRLGRTQLERALAKRGRSGRDFEIRWSPVLAGAAALALIVAAALSHRTPLESSDASHQSRDAQGETKVEEETFQPTMLALRHEVEAGREPIIAAAPAGAGMQHYRVKDVESELRN